VVCGTRESVPGGARARFMASWAGSLLPAGDPGSGGLLRVYSTNVDNPECTVNFSK
jgi:hypothetical protein